MLESDVVVEDLRVGGADQEERRLFSPKGEMAQILNRSSESFRQLVYWDLDTTRSGQERGHHFHDKKVDRIYIISGEVEFVVEDPSNLERKVLRARAGSRVTIAPRLAHAFRSTTYTQALEYSPDPYDPADTHPYKLEGW
jgi:dTDP-4-dehydrorhamnose 3,5-epimerase-like enzyme